MGNSSPDVKAVAKIVVADNNSDGVAEAIKKYILGD
jgi:hydroxymethylpyrimidine pyrophosphatase-like HAD family hydrolase